jgi:lipopolysaccharide export system protein LptA
MKRSEAAKYARWSAAVALLVAIATAAVYVERAWVRHVAQENAPPPAPLGVERESTTISFSKVEENHTIFTVEASKSTDFKGEDASLLEDVRITIFGKTGARHDTIHTKSCRYSKVLGSITCAGEVQIDLLSAADAQFVAQHPEQTAQRIMRVETSGVTLERANGLAKTDQPVTFQFPNGQGQAIGIEYNSDEGALRLERNVRVTLQGLSVKATKSNAATQEVEISGSQMDFEKDTHILDLKGPATATMSQGRLTAGELRVELDPEFHAREIDAIPGSGESQPEMTFRSSGGEEQNLKARLIRATLSPQGWVGQLDAEENVQAEFRTAGQTGMLTASKGRVVLWPRTSQPQEIDLDGAVILRTEAKQREEERELHTDALRVLYSEAKGPQASHPTLAQTEAPGNVTWVENVTSTKGAEPVETKLQADKLALNFDSSRKAQKLTAAGNVQTKRSVPGKPVETATAREGLANLVAGGGWSEMQLQGDVDLKEGTRTAQADQAVFLRAAQTATLTGHALFRDAATETSAAKITFAQNSGEITAEGGVHTAEFQSKGSALELAPAPANIISDVLKADSKSDRAVYKGHARLWQGDAVLQGDTIVLQRDAGILTAAGNVRAVFPQVPGRASVNTAAKKNPVLCHVAAGELTYWDKENRAHLQRNVLIETPAESMRSDSLDLYFTRSTANSGTNGAQQISRAIATGDVVVEQGSRRATAETGEYTAADGKFVMSGGNPTIFDAASGTTTGRQLTFFLADDTIIVDSENGSRTLTKHRVEK